MNADGLVGLVRTEGRRHLTHRNLKRTQEETYPGGFWK